MEQTENTRGYFKQLLTDEAIDHFGIDLGKDVTYTATGGRLDCVTSNPRRVEGARPTAQTATEAGLFVSSNSGVDLFQAMERGAAKDPMCRTLLSSNAYAVGEGSVLEKIDQDYDDIQSGRMIDTGLNYDSLSAPADTNVFDPESLRHGIDQARGDAWWLDVDRKLQVALSKRTSVESTLRFELNIPAAADTALYTQLDWDACADTSLKLNEGDTITLGLDVSLKNDATALVASRVEDRAMFLLALAEKGPRDGDDWQVDVGQFDRAIALAFETFDVVGFFSDVNPIQGHIESWEQTYGDKVTARFDSKNAIAADMRNSQRRFTQAHEALMAGIFDRRVKHDGNLDLRRHVLNVHQKQTNAGISFAKESRFSIRKIDAYAAMLLADMARQEYATSVQQRVKERKPNRATIYRR